MTTFYLGNATDGRLISRKSTNPGFTDAGAGDFSLTSSSAVRNAGTSTASSGVVDDYIGTARPQGGAYAMGAYER